MHGGDESNFVTANIKNSEFSYLIGLRKDLAQLYEIEKSGLPHDRVPAREG
jgi:hypothetical protein